MKSNYIRIFLLSMIFIIFVSLFTHWDTMFSDSKPSVNNTKTVKNIVNKNISGGVQKDLPAKKIDYNDKSFKTIDISTDAFKDLKISEYNGALISASLKKYHKTIENKKPMELLTANKSDKYIIQNNIIVNGKISNVVFKKKGLTNTNDITTLTIEGHNRQIKVVKKYIINNSKYTILLKQKVSNISKKALNIRFDNNILRNYDPSGKKFSLLNMHSYAFNGVAISSDKSNFEKTSFKKINDKNINETTNKGWAAVIHHYFITALVPVSSNGKFDIYSDKISDNSFKSGYSTFNSTVDSNSTLNNDLKIYAGPIIKKDLEQVAPNLGLAIDYGILSFISVIIFWLMNLIHSFVNNWGLSIILVTIVIKIIFSPLSAKSYSSMAKMRVLQPKLKQIQELYKGDRQKLGQKMMEMYKEEKVSPVAGCLPIVVQIPVFIALYWVLLESVQLRQAPFFFWIHDLSVKDPYFILPIIMGLSMFLQQKISPAPTDKMQARIMMFMPVVFTVFFASFPSGLVLYWITNNLVSISQQWYITRGYINKKVKHKR